MISQHQEVAQPLLPSADGLQARHITIAHQPITPLVFDYCLGDVVEYSHK
jgi:hypothetical protein